jgi:hypothetical protein
VLGDEKGIQRRRVRVMREVCKKRKRRIQVQESKTLRPQAGKHKYA